MGGPRRVGGGSTHPTPSPGALHFADRARLDRIVASQESWAAAGMLARHSRRGAALLRRAASLARAFSDDATHSRDQRGADAPVVFSRKRERLPPPWSRRLPALSAHPCCLACTSAARPPPARSRQPGASVLCAEG